MIKDLAREAQGLMPGDTERSGGERSEAPRSGGSPGIERVTATPEVPDPEVAARPKRRQFTAEYKLRIVREADACSRPGEIGALLRREGLYSSLLTEWRRARDTGALVALRRSGAVRAGRARSRSSSACCAAGWSARRPISRRRAG